MFGVNRPILTIAVLVCLIAAASPAAAAVIQRAITIDGDMDSDWRNGTPTLSDDIPENSPDQASGDGEGDPPNLVCPGSTDDDAYDNFESDTGTCVGLPGGVGRDLRTFAFTYDANNLYLFVGRYESSNNVTDWWFFLDTDNDERMESSDLLLRVKWQGTNQSTDKEYWTYVPDSPVGDPLVGGADNDGDGYNMPGTIQDPISLGTVNGGSTDGLEMETLVPWADICGFAGCGPKSIGFHIASSNGSNLPQNNVDNMTGPGGGSGGGSALVFLDLSLQKTASATELPLVTGGDPTVTFSITVTNEGGGDATGIEVEDILDPNFFEFVAADDANYDDSIGIWTIPLLAESDSITLNIEARSIGAGSATNTATIVDLNEVDTDSNNDDDSVMVNIASPDLRITKTHPGVFKDQADGSYTLIVSNEAGAGPHQGVITIEDTLPAINSPVTGSMSFSGYSGTGWICVDSGAGTVADPVIVTCEYGIASSILAAGASLPPLTLIAFSDFGADVTVDNTAEVVPAADVVEAVTGGSGDNIILDPTDVETAPDELDLAITKTVINATPAVMSDLITFTITVTNNGPIGANNIVIDDLLPAGLSYDSHSATPGGPGSYDSMTGVWQIGSLVNGNSGILTLNATADMGTGGTTLTNTATISGVDEFDSNTGNNTASASVVPVEANLSTSTKSVVDLNGGQVNPGDQLRYTITLIESGGADALDVAVLDDAPANTGSISNIVVTGATPTDASDSNTLDLSDFTVPANGSVTIEFEVTVDASAPDFGSITNSADVTSSTAAGVTVSAPPVTVRRGEVKPFYLHNVATAAGTSLGSPAHPAFNGISGRSMNRRATTNTTAVTVGNTELIWLMDPEVFASTVIEDQPGSSIAAQLVMSRAGNGSKEANVTLYFDANCDGAGGVAVASSGDQAVLGNTDEVETFSLDLSSNVTLNPGECLYLGIRSTVNGKSFDVIPYSATFGTESRIDLPVFGYINVDALEVYDAADTGLTTPLSSFEVGQDIVIRILVSDPFGSFDITSVELTILTADLDEDVSSEELVDTASMKAYLTETVTASSREFLYEYTPPLSEPAGTWKIFVDSVEGLEVDPITADDDDSYTAVPPQPEITVQKKIYEETGTTEIAEIHPDDAFVYEITITNIGAGEAADLVIEDAVSDFTALEIDYVATDEPFDFIDSVANPSGYTGIDEWQYSIDGGATFLNPALQPLQDGRDTSASGFDGAVTDIRILMPGSPGETMDPDGEFIIRYRMRIR